MRPGKLRMRLAIQVNRAERDEFGEPAPDAWDTVAVRWGQVEPLSGRERFVADQTGSQVTHRIRLRMFDGLTAKHRLRIGCRVFSISSVVQPDERGREHLISAIEVVA